VKKRLLQHAYVAPVQQQFSREVRPTLAADRPPITKALREV
jgi:hypothetical protein